MSKLQNFAFFALWSEITLFAINFDSIKEAAGDAVSSGYSSLSPPTVSQTRYGSDLSGL